MFSQPWEDCSDLIVLRLTWQYIHPPVSFPEQSFPPIETLHGWLTLHWPKEAFTQLEGVKEVVAAIKTSDLSSSTPEILQHCCSSVSTPPNVAIRLAQTDVDVVAITRLVQGLADFEKEPDAVNMTADHYRMDGSLTSGSEDGMSLFRCLLLESIPNDGSESYVFGMAFVYVGCTQKDGPFVYLEDLFIEEPYRGRGAGSVLMQVLACIASSLGHCRVVWQALDWNTPALTFYRKLGAEVVDGLVTARFAGDDLRKVADIWNARDNQFI